jgi:hypothetical protein
MFKVELEDGTQKCSREELIQHLKNPTKVHKAERVEVDREYIKDKVEKRLQEAYSEILEHHGLLTGDVGFGNKLDMDEAEEEVIDATAEWIKTRLNEYE